VNNIKRTLTTLRISRQELSATIARRLGTGLQIASRRRYVLKEKQIPRKIDLGFSEAHMAESLRFHSDTDSDDQSDKDDNNEDDEDFAFMAISVISSYAYTASELPLIRKFGTLI
jgi:hypothetical protein